ncbi:MAG: hypothetical protein RLZ98_1296 [Pseudomonadota bacterium]|jgi:tripartite-type tricarboxylate transporter receptor subunit TctC
MPKRTLFAAAALAMLPISQAGAQADDTASFYRANSQITMIVGFGPGSGYDRWARFIARYMPKYIPGNPTFIVKNMPGAGSVIAINHLANVAPKDGSVIAVFTRNAPSQALLGRSGIKFDPRTLGWIGSPTVPSRVCALLADSGVASVEELRKKEVPVGGTGPATAPSFLPIVLNRLAGTKFKVVEGYRSSEEVHLALERKEVFGICQSFPSIYMLNPEWVNSGKLRVLFNMESKRNPKLKGVPTIFEYMTDKKDKQILQFISSSTEFGRPFAAPPGLPAARLAALRQAFDATMQDEAFIKEAAKQGMDVSPRTGAELEQLVTELYEIPKPVQDEARALMGKGKKK